MASLVSSLEVQRRSDAGVQCCILCGGTEHVEHLQAPDRFHAASRIYRLVRCVSCSLVWLQDPPPPDEMSAHYGRDYDNFIRRATDQDPEKGWRTPREMLQKHSSGGNLLDLGCGAGNFLKGMQMPGWNLYGIEMSPDTAKAAELTTSAKVFCGDILAADFPDGHFDAITCFHVFEHVYEPRQVMERVAKWLKPGGIFYLYVPNIGAAEARLFGSYWYPLELPRHLYHFSPNSLRKLARVVGLDEVTVFTQEVSFIEYSTRYLVDSFLAWFGLRRASLAQAHPPGLIWRACRKVFRLTVNPLVSWMTSGKETGQIVGAIFRK
jgi:2-polyprenyl-3-methyl-5-hydroxy-6-metoxy-1,4-benzoquinol methylase